MSFGYEYDTNLSHRIVGAAAAMAVAVGAGLTVRIVLLDDIAVHDNVHGLPCEMICSAFG